MPIRPRILWGAAPVTSENIRLEMEHLCGSINKILSNLGYTAGPTGAQIKAKILALPDSNIPVQTIDGKVIANQLLKSSQDFIFETASGATPFSATDNDTVTWSAFTLRFADGSVYAIATGNTGNISTTRLTYIYFDASISVTTLNVTTDYNEAVGKERLLSCVCQGTSDTSQYAFYIPAVGAFGINSSNIQANSISATQIAAGAVTAAKISVAQLSAISADMGSLTAGSIIVGSTNKLWLNSAADGNLRIGGSVYADAPFQVSAAGALTATSAILKTAGATKYIDIGSGIPNEMQFFEGGVAKVRIGSEIFSQSPGIIMSDGVLDLSSSYVHLSNSNASWTFKAKMDGAFIPPREVLEFLDFGQAGVPKYVRFLFVGSALGIFQTNGIIESLVSQGTPPMIVASTTAVADFNADLLDGNHASAFATATHSHATGDITSGTFADARIAASNVTQHQASLSIAVSQLTGGLTETITVKDGSGANMDMNFTNGSLVSHS